MVLIVMSQRKILVLFLIVLLNKGEKQKQPYCVAALENITNIREVDGAYHLEVASLARL